MNKVLNEDRFFSMTWDYLHVYLPTQHRDSPKTAKSYEDGLTIFRRYLTDALSVSMADFRFEDLTYDFLLDYRIYLAETGCKPRTVNHRLAVIMAYMRYAASRKTALTQIYLNIADVPYMTVPSKIREIIEDKAALECFLAAPKPSKKGIRDQIILVVLYDTAIRVEELINLDLSDICIKAEADPYIRVRGKGDKERFVPLSDKSIPLIRQYIEIYHPDCTKRSVPFIYTVLKGRTGRMSARNIERIVQKYADQIRCLHPSIPEKVYPHMLRRTRASGWYRDKVPIETIAVVLGHADTKTTRKSYASPSVEMLRQQLNNEKLTDAVPSSTEEPLWKDDQELARLCGIR
jgi:site-specific recombinase XerD